MNSEYHLADGTPRYGSRSAESGAGEPAKPRSSPGIRVEDAAEGAARLGLDDLAAAIDRRLTSHWADASDPLVEALRADHPEELAAARALVKLHLGSQRQWRLKAQAVRDKHLEPTLRRRRASGSARAVLALRLVLMIALISLPAYIVATDRENLLKLVLAGVACIAVAMAGGHFITVYARVPVMPNIRGAWLSELRDDVVNATLVAILLNKGAGLEPRVVAAGQRGWKNIQAAALVTQKLHA
jgi:hypothetical protein